MIAGETCGDTKTPPTAVVNRSFATLYLPGLTPLGAHVEVVPPNVMTPVASIVGVVANAREQGLNEEPAPTIYWCNSAPVPTPLFLVRTQAAAPLAIAETIRRKVHELDPARAVYDVMPLEQHLNDTRVESRLRTVLLTAFALTAVSLAAVGLYGTLSYLVSIRRREIGVRMAMGALRRETVLLFLKQAIGVSLAGCAAGLWLAAALGRALSGMLYGVSPLDLTTFAAVLVLMLLVAALSSVWPAVRAARVDPMQVLRDE